MRSSLSLVEEYRSEFALVFTFARCVLEQGAAVEETQTSRSEKNEQRRGELDALLESNERARIDRHSWAHGVLGNDEGIVVDLEMRRKELKHQTCEENSPDGKGKPEGDVVGVGGGFTKAE